MKYFCVVYWETGSFNFLMGQWYSRLRCNLPFPVPQRLINNWVECVLVPIPFFMSSCKNKRNCFSRSENWASWYTMYIVRNSGNCTTQIKGDIPVSLQVSNKAIVVTILGLLSFGSCLSLPAILIGFHLRQIPWCSHNNFSGLLHYSLINHRINI